ncbi:T9SS type A sorting domain-containing protein [Candidatus Neomarinimicrobiota bacterium]
MKRTVIALTVLGLFMAWPVHAQNLIGNSDLEDLTPAFWSPLNATFGTDVFVSTDTATSGFASFKITKSAAGASEVGWESDNNANKYWNHATAGVFALSAMVKTVGVNTSPATDADKIGVEFTFNDTLGAELSIVTLWAGQAAASTPFTKLTGIADLSERPGDVIVKLIMGSGATGTVYFDEIGCGTDPWSMGVFNGSAENVNGWLDWYSSTAGGFTRVTDTEAHGGTYAVEMFLPDTSTAETELVHYTIPYAVDPGEWYKVGVWIKTMGVIDSSVYWQTNTLTERLNERVNLCYFFHSDPNLETGWSPTGGDQFVYVDQTVADSGWANYVVLAKAPAEATGISMRARFNPKTTGTAFFDDFSIEKIEVEGSNLIGNGDLEDLTPAFWSPLNATFGTDVFVATDTATSGFASFKITKSAAGASEVGWESDNNANKYWNHATAGVFALSAMVKTVGVNTSPATDADKIGVEFTFNDTLGAELSIVTLWAGQAAASTPFTKLTGIADLSERPGDVIVKLIMGSGATGTVYFDEIGCGTDPWSMGVFNGSAENVNGWLDWYSSTAGGFTRVTDTEAHGGTYAVEMFLPDTSTAETELVHYTIPYAVDPGEWYKVGVWIKTMGVIDSSVYWQTNTLTERLNERVNLCYFFHSDPNLETGWSPTGGDQFVYVDQTVADSGWANYVVLAKAPAEATGISMRARFNPKTTGAAWFDDFSITKMVVAPVVPTGVRNGVARVPTEYRLSQNFPNPFNPQTSIQFSCPNLGWVRMDVYNLLGQRVTTLVDGIYQGGTYNVNWEGVDDRGVPVASGVYIYSLMTNDTRIARKMLLIR